MEVVPAINEVDRREVERKLRTAESFAAERVQIDFADKQKALGAGVLAQYVSLAPAEINYEIHIMSEEPEKEFPFWLFPKVERIIFHLENSVNPLDFKNNCLKEGKAAGLGICANTSNELIFPLLKHFDFFLVLAVSAGQSGDSFNEMALEKIKFLREKAPQAIIEVDGGVNFETAKMVKEAGANIIVSSSYIFDSPDPAGAFQELKNL